ncbi:MAG: cysteine--tRNA ligase [Deltaproteobacteria bacterium GWB2_65_81]|nr:MAG: cysteine--tRNA ligase [Deltaproteobacteria bacterium GWB2_65_81]OGP37616.1 MAG: cysteine--tRNA ligase [Deltaproteobacteria bacterium GWC2_66_88]
MGLSLHESVSRRKVPFAPADPTRVTIYTCGPTVYRNVHIGNLRTYLLTDILVRTLRFLGYGTFTAQNITDMGHMHQEQLELGEDKVIAAARAAGKSAREIAAFFTEAYFRDCRRMAFLPADVYPRASEHVPEMIALVLALEDRGAVYGGDGYIYFDVSKVPGYGAFSGTALGEGTPAERTDPEGHRRKRRPEDFVLWMPAEPGREFQWDSPWGRGWPGWHSECAAMAIKHLGPEFDLHVGGIDLRFPHHENSRALATTATGKRFAAHWIHAAHLLVEGRKMSKSAGNEYTLDDLEAGPPSGGKGTSAAEFRYYCLTLHYATPMNFTWEGQAAAARALSRLRGAYAKAAERGTAGEDAAAALRDKFRSAVSDDLNLPRAVAVAHEAPRSGVGGEAARALAAEWDRILAVGLLPAAESGREPEGVPPEVEAMARERDARRRACDYRAADALRERIRASGYDVVDAAEGSAALRKIRGTRER